MSEFSKCRVGGTLKDNIASLYEIPVTQVDCKFSVVSLRDTQALKQALRRHAKANDTPVVVVHAMRDASCASCREHGQQLSELAVTSRQFALVGVVKEMGVNDQGILTFYQDYFRGNSIFLDKKFSIYKAWGRGDANFLKSLIPVMLAFGRQRRKGVVFGEKLSTNLLRGGVLVFDRNGELRFAIETYEFYELDLNLVSSAVTETRRLYKLEKQERKQSSLDMSEAETETTDMTDAD